MKKTTISILFLLCTLPVFSQQGMLLKKYRAMALQYNHNLKAAEKNISASIELEKSARANQKPRLVAGANFQYTGNPAELTLNLPGMGQPMTFQGNDIQYGTSVSLLQPIYTGGRVIESIRLAQLRQSFAGSQAELIRSFVCYQTDIQYWNTVARQEIVGVATDFRNSIYSLTQTIKERVDAGLVDPQDLLMAEVKLNEAEYQLLQAQNNFKTGQMALNSLIGIELQIPVEIELEVPKVIADESLLRANGSNRPELKMANDEIKMAESTLKLNDSQYKPQFHIGIDGGYSSPGYNFNKDLDPNYAVYTKLSVPVFEWGKRRNEKRASQERIGMADDNLNKVEDEVSLEIQTAQVDLLQALERIVMSENSLGKARKNEEMATERYNEGKISILEIIDAQTYRQTAQINYVQAKVAAQSHYSALIKAVNAYK